MEHPCQHCAAKIVGNAYRVTSEDAGIRLLDMIVCSLCAMEAKRLRLHTQEVTILVERATVRNRRTHPSRFPI